MAFDLLRTPSDENFAWKIVEFVLPVDEAKRTAFTVGLEAFVPSIIFFGSLMVAWYTIIGIVSSAHSGKVLGEKYHQIWAPLRVILGFGMLMSLTPTGITGAHHLERLIYRVGTNLGDNIALAGATYVIKDGHPITPLGAGGKDIAWSVVRSDLCSVVYAQASKRDDVFQSPAEQAGNRNMTRLPAARGEPVITPASSSWLPWGEDTPERVGGYAWDWGLACGSFSLSAPTDEEFGTFGEDRRRAVATLITEVREIGVAERIAKAFAPHGTSETFDPNRIAADLNKMDVWTDGGLIAPDIVSRVQKIVSTYDVSIANSAARISASENREMKTKLMEGVQTHGWVMLGSYYRMMSRITEKSTSLAAEMPTVREPNPDAWGAYKNEVQVALEIIRTQHRAEANRLVVSGDDLAAVHEDASFLADMINSISRPVLEYTTGYSGWRPDPVGDLATIGNRMLVGSQVAFTAGLAATGTAALGSTFTQSAMKIVDYVMVPGWWLIGISFITGILLVYVLPMMQTIFMYFALGALALETVAFAVACVLWAFIHIRMDGPELVDQAQSIGYKAIFSLMLRQPITVLGLLAQSVLSTVLLNIFLMTWNMSYVGSIPSIGLVGSLVGFGLMIFIQWHINLRIGALMLELPTKVGAIFGATVSGWSDGDHGTTVIAGSAGGINNNMSLGKPKGGDTKSPKSDSDKSGGGVSARAANMKDLADGRS